MSTIEKKSLKVGKYVNTEHVDTLVRNYKKDRWMQNSERIGQADSLGVWVSAEELEEFIQTAKNNGADGIRLYFGVYGENGPREGMKGRQTVAFVATASEEVENSDTLVHNDIYVERNGKPSILAYNQILILPGTPPIPGTGTMTMGTQVGSMMIADVENGLRVI